jgi:peptidoglycan-associated lipoprotein
LAAEGGRKEQEMKHFRTSLCVALVSAALAGCGSSVKLDESAAPVVDAKANPAGGAAGAGRGATTAQSAVTTVDASKIDPVAAGNLGRVVYFDYDSYVLKDEFRPLIEGYARMLSGAKTKKMVSEGHTDERGGREYNLALGQRRAEAVARSLMLLGVSDSQIEAVSFGKERPVNDGHDEAAWAKNRRAELKDR